jgi:hypothetical protein
MEEYDVCFTIVDRSNFPCVHYAKTWYYDLTILLLMLKPSHVVICDM